MNDHAPSGKGGTDTGFDFIGYHVGAHQRDILGQFQMKLDKRPLSRLTGAQVVDVADLRMGHGDVDDARAVRLIEFPVHQGVERGADDPPDVPE